MKYPGCRYIQLISLDRDLPQAKRLQVVEEINYPSNSHSWTPPTWDPAWIITNFPPQQQWKISVNRFRKRGHFQNIKSKLSLDWIQT